MKPAPFEYHAPHDLGQALADLAGAGEHGKVLAGGQSLIPLLNMRLAAPEHLIDINGLAELATIDVDEHGVTVGALARHAQVERSPEAADAQPLLRLALRLVAHPVIRNRGTVVGSLVHADPAAELPAVLALLDGSVRLARHGSPEDPHTGPGTSANGTRWRDVPASDFFVGPLESAIQPGELAVSAYFPNLPERSGVSFREVARRHGDYALAGVAAVVTLDDDLLVGSARAACIGVGPVPLVVDVTEQCGHRPPSAVDWAAAARAVQAGTEPEADIHATAEYRRHLVAVIAEQALREAAGGA